MRRTERDRLAWAGAAAGEHSAPLEDRRDSGGLNRERRCRTQVGERAHEVVTETEAAERHISDLFGLDRLGLHSLEELPALAPYLPEIDVLDEIAERGRG